MIEGLEAALSKYRPDSTAAGLAVLDGLEALFPEAKPIVFEARYAVTVSLSYSEKWMDGFCFVAFYAKHANLSFQHGAQLTDPTGLLKGTGKQVRHVRLDSTDMLNRMDVLALVRQAAGLKVT